MLDSVDRMWKEEHSGKTTSFIIDYILVTVQLDKIDITQLVLFVSSEKSEICAKTFHTSYCRYKIQQHLIVLINRIKSSLRIVNIVEHQCSFGLLQYRLVVTMIIFTLLQIHSH